MIALLNIGETSPNLLPMLILGTRSIMLKLQAKN